MTCDRTEARHWTEIEVEPGSGGRELLSRIESHFAGVGLHCSATHSELARALGWSAPPPPPPPSPAKATAGELVRRYLATQLATIVGHDVGVRLDLPDAVHSTRVAIRRLRSTFRVFRPCWTRA